MRKLQEKIKETNLHGIVGEGVEVEKKHRKQTFST